MLTDANTANILYLVEHEADELRLDAVELAMTAKCGGIGVRHTGELADSYRLDLWRHTRQAAERLAAIAELLAAMASGAERRHDDTLGHETRERLAVRG